MRKLIVESRVFTQRVHELLDQETYRQLQNTLLDSPDKGDVVPGCGGLRKLRVEEPRRGKGKRGGCRVIYLHIPEAERIDLVSIYSKSEQDDLTMEQKRVLKALAEQAQREARRIIPGKGERGK